MPADKNFAMVQLRRFSSFPGKPDSSQELLERAGYLAKASLDNENCEAITDRLYATVKYFPLPVDIDAAAEAVRLAATPEWTGNYGEPKCSLCGDTGWLFQPAPSGFTGSVTRCTHEAGLYPAAKGAA